MNIIRIPPAGGKTWLAKRYPGKFVDSDALVWVLGYEASKSGVEKMMNDGGWDDDIVSAIVGNRTLLTNFDPNWLNETDRFKFVNVGYNPEDYVQHIEDAGRQDLLENFSKEELESWMNFEPDYVLKPGFFIADIINNIKF